MKGKVEKEEKKSKTNGSQENHVDRIMNFLFLVLGFLG